LQAEQLQKDNEFRQAQQAQQIRFQTAENAFRAIQLSNQSKQLDMQQQEFNDNHDKFVQATVANNQDKYGTVYDVIPRNSAAAMDYLKTLHANGVAQGQQGAAIPSGVMMDSQNIYVPKPGVNSLDSQYKQYADYSKALGQPSMSESQFGQIGSDGREKLGTRLQNMLAGKDTDGPNAGWYGKNVQSSISNLQTARDNYAKDPNADKSILDLMDKGIAAATSVQASNDKHADEQADKQSNRILNREQQIADDKQQREDARKYGYAVNPQTNEVSYVSKADADAKGLSNFEPQTPTTIKSDVHDIKVLNDVVLKANRVRSMAQGIDPSSWGPMAKVLADNPNDTVNQIMKEKAFGALSSKQQDYVIAVLNLRESSMGLQKVLTGTARSNETQIQALQNTLPGVEPSSDVVNKKLDQFNQNMELLRGGLPRNLQGVTMIPIQSSGSSNTATQDTAAKHGFK